MKNNVKCEYCGKEFYKEPFRIKKDKHNFCCVSCHDKFRHEEKIKEMSAKVGMDFKKWLIQKYIKEKLGQREIAEILYRNRKNFSSVGRWLNKLGIPQRHGSEAIKTQWINNEERRKMQAKAIKKVMTPEVREKIIKTMNTKESKEKQKKSHSGKANGMYGVVGENHPQWNPNRTHEQRVTERKTLVCKRWRKYVFTRDNFTCQCCGDNTGNNLVAHHLNSYDVHEKSRYKTNNGITLCEKCHKAFHKKYGYGENTKEQYNEFKKNNKS